MQWLSPLSCTSSDRSSSVCTTAGHARTGSVCTGWALLVLQYGLAQRPPAPHPAVRAPQAYCSCYDRLHKYRGVVQNTRSRRGKVQNLEPPSETTKSAIRTANCHRWRAPRAAQPPHMAQAEPRTPVHPPVTAISPAAAAAPSGSSTKRKRATAEQIDGRAGGRPRSFTWTGRSQLRCLACSA